MTHRILKYEIPVVTQEFTIRLPVDGHILSVQAQHNVPQMWVRGNMDAPTEEVRFLLLTTGEPIARSVGAFLGTFQLHEGRFIGHVFRAGSP